jgi:hypothetical protein
MENWEARHSCDYALLKVLWWDLTTAINIIHDKFWSDRHLRFNFGPSEV